MNHLTEYSTDEEFKKWTDRIGKGTIPSYVKALKLWVYFNQIKYGIVHTPKTLIDEIEEDRKKSRRETGLVETKLVKFHRWLLEEYQATGRYGKEIRIGVSEKRATSYVMAIRSFYKWNKFPIIKEDLTKDLIKIPEERLENKKHQFTMAEITKMVNYKTNTPLDKAILIFQPQSMMDTSTISKNVKFKTLIMGFKEMYPIPKNKFIRALIEALRATQKPLLLGVKRVKTKNNYITFVGVDSCRLVADYLEWAYLDNEKEPKLDDVVFTHNDMPLLYGEGLEKFDYISPLWKKLVIELMIINPATVSSADVNPGRPHAGRASISEILKEHVSNNIVEHWMGHKIDRTQLAYALTLQKSATESIEREEKMREIYAKHEYLISLE